MSLQSLFKFYIFPSFIFHKFILCLHPSWYGTKTQSTPLRWCPFLHLLQEGLQWSCSGHEVIREMVCLCHRFLQTFIWAANGQRNSSSHLICPSACCIPHHINIMKQWLTVQTLVVLAFAQCHPPDRAQKSIPPSHSTLNPALGRQERKLQQSCYLVCSR